MGLLQQEWRQGFRWARAHQKACAEMDEVCKILELEGVTVKDWVRNRRLLLVNLFGAHRGTLRHYDGRISSTRTIGFSQ